MALQRESCLPDVRHKEKGNGMYVLINITDDGCEKSVGLVGFYADVNEARDQMRTEYECELRERSSLYDGAEDSFKAHSEIGDWMASVSDDINTPWDQWHILDKQINERAYF